MTALKKVIRPVPKSAPDRPQQVQIMDAIFPSLNGAINDRYLLIDRDKIEPNPFQSRKNFNPDSLTELGDSMFQDGQIQAITVRPHPTRPGRYQLVSGERRWRASEPRNGFNGLPRLKALVREVEDSQMGDLAFTENIQRDELTPAEEVARVAELVKDGLSQVQIEERYKKNRNWAYKRIKAARVPDDLKWLLDHPQTLDLVLEANKVKEPRHRYKVVQFLKSRAEKGEGCSVSQLKEFIRLSEPPKAAPRQTPQAQESAWTTRNVPESANAPDTSPNATAGHHAPNNGISVTHSRDVPAQPAHSVQTTIEYPNETLVQGQNVPRYPNEKEMLPEAVAGLPAKADEALKAFCANYARLKNDGVFAYERRLEIKAVLQSLEAHVTTALEMIDA